MDRCMPEKDNQEAAVREVYRVYELIKTQQPLLLLVHQHHLGTTTHHHHQLAQSLLSEALRALNIALSAMKQQLHQDTNRSTDPSAPLSSSSGLGTASAAAAADSKLGATAGTSKRSGKRRRPVPDEGKKNSSSWVNLTTMPYEDGYEWRKYGEKKINGTQFTRSYFRCTYKYDKGCLATKYVQQKDNTSDPPVFEVTYNNEHTCNCTSSTSSSPHTKTINSNGCYNSNLLPTTRGADTSSSDHPIKKEAIAVLPPLADVPATVPFGDQIPCQEPPLFPIGDHCVSVSAGDHAGIPFATRSSTGNSSCVVSGVFCDELDMGPIMVEPLFLGDDDLELHDLDERLLLYNSFNYY